MTDLCGVIYGGLLRQWAGSGILEESTSILEESYDSSRSLLLTLEYYCGVIWTIMGW